MYLKWLKSVLAKILCKPLSMCGNHSDFLRTRPKDQQDLDFELNEKHVPAGFFQEDI